MIIVGLIKLPYMNQCCCFFPVGFLSSISFAFRIYIFQTIIINTANGATKAILPSSYHLNLNHYTYCPNFNKYPPSTGTICPFKYWLVAANKIAFAMSLSFPGLLAGRCSYFSAGISLFWLSLLSPAVISDGKTPGAMALILTLTP